MHAATDFLERHPVIRGLIQIVAAYVFGIVFGNIFLIFLSGPLVFIVAIAGLICGLPLLGIALLTYILLRPWVLRNLRAVCLAVPFVASAAWLPIEWWISGNNIDLWPYIIQGEAQFTLLIFVCSFISAILFWGWQRTTLRQIQDSTP